MPAFRIAVIGGDGIGPEVIEQAIRVADAAVSARRFDLIGKPRPNLRHLQHDGFGLFIHGGSRDL